MPGTRRVGHNTYEDRGYIPFRPNNVKLRSVGGGTSEAQDAQIPSCRASGTANPTSKVL